ncbi:MAG: FtsX-like permease family protein [Candidatus Altiarchaeota archaeon]
MLDIAFKNVFRAKSRSALTILSIAMGIGLIMALAAIGEGLNANIDAMAGDLAGTIDVQATEDDAIDDGVIDQIRDMENVEDVIQVATYRITRGRGRFGFPGGGRMGGPGDMFGGGSGGGATNIEFTAVNPEDLTFLVDESIVAQEGRKIDEADDNKLLVLMGYTAATSNQLNVGDEITYERTENDTTETFEFEVVGILEETTEDDIEQATYVPLSTMQEIEDDDTIESLKVKLKDVEKTQETTELIQTEIENVRVMSILSMVERLQETLGTVQTAVYGIAAISLIVGGIGIMNTMVMTVMERRREIGVMKAIGATTTMVLTQILQESAILSILGGIAGLSLGYGATYAIESYTTFTTVITMQWVSLALGFSLALGMGAGLYPAYKASQLDPIEVLRYE